MSATMSVVIPLVAQAVLPALGVLLVFIARRYVGNKAAREALEWALDKAVDYAEEWAHKAAKEGAEKLTPGGKLSAAVSAYNELTRKFDVPELTAQQLEKLLHAKLASKR